MSETKLLIALNKLLVAQNFINVLPKYIKIENNNDDMYKFLELINGRDHLKIHLALDVNRNEQSIQNFLYRLYPDIFNKNYIDSIAKGLIYSYPTLLSIIKVSEKSIRVYDEILEISYDIFNEDLDYSEEDCLFARVINIDGYNFILTEINVLESFHKDIFLDLINELFINNGKFFEYKKKNDSEKIMMILKSKLPDILFTYTLSLTEFIEIEEEKNFEKEKIDAKKIFFSEEDLEIFEKYCEYSAVKYDIDEERILFYFNLLYDSSNLLSKNSFSDFKNFSFKSVFLKAAENGVIYTESMFKEVLMTLRNYYKFALKYSDKFQKPYDEVSDIVKDIFIYLHKLKDSVKGFYFDENILRYTGEPDNFKLMDKFIDFLDALNLSEVTISKSNTLTTKSLKNVVEFLDIKPIKDVKVPNQSHYPLINFFFNFLHVKDMIETHNGDLTFKDKLNRFLVMETNQQLALFIHYLLSGNFLSKFLRKSTIDNYFENLYSICAKLDKSAVKLEDLNISSEFLFLITLLNDANALTYYDGSVKFSSLGQNLYDYYKYNYSLEKVINLNNYI
ncbi:hypothetical protein ING2D1G_1383 [Peptoniphilus sp. ING2-D1G]|nr:hypothetical protein ING2D1G_1383 [Peptoniphilus sp. ING2-D1G]